jgi:hypothetical protein
MVIYMGKVSFRNLGVKLIIIIIKKIKIKIKIKGKILV